MSYYAMPDLVFEARQLLARLVHAWPARVTARTVDRARKRLERRIAQREAADRYHVENCEVR